MRVSIVSSSSFILLFCIWRHASAFSSSNLDASYSSVTSKSQSQQQQQQQLQQQPVGNILILDHLNINHEKGRHDWLKAFYFDFLHCAVDPRKQDNLAKGEGTVWANIGANQFHLPEGKPDAQVLQGVVTLAYPDVMAVQNRYDKVKTKLEGSKFDMTVEQEQGEQSSPSALVVTDPWGTQFRIVPARENERDNRGQQPSGDDDMMLSEGCALRDLTIYTSTDCNMVGIARFYKHILGAPVLSQTENDDRCVVSVGPQQTLTFQKHPEEHSSSQVTHVDLRDDHVESPKGFPSFLSNYGPHVSIYVADLAASYQKAQALGLTYVNPRFKRRAYNLEQAMNDCMFRCLDIVDPDNDDGAIILKLEHEVRSVVKRDGTMYKSCPFDVIPPECYKS